MGGALESSGSRTLRSGRGRRKVAALLGGLVATLFGLAVALGGGELAARIVMPHWSEFASERFASHVSQPGFGSFAMGRPGFDGWFAQNNGDFRVSIHIDGNGLRNPDGARSDGALWAIGDSFTFGWGVEREESFGAVAARGLGLEFFSLASPGTNLCGYMGLVARGPSPAKPRAVVLGLTMENDIDDYVDCEAPGVVAPLPPSNQLKRNVKEWLLANSAFYNLVATTLKRSPRLIMLLQRMHVVEDVLAVDWNAGGYSPEKLDRTAAAVARLRSMLPADVPFAVLVIPARHDLMEDGGNWGKDRAVIVDAMTGRGLTVIDPSPQLRAAGAAQVHFAHDGHWSVAGQRMAGEIVSDTLKPLLSKDASR
jgi:hypothetical protein